jgi:uncharacterized protein YndB with AHSA1/START domain
MTTHLHETLVTTPSDTTIRIERIFNAPRELVWRAYTEPELLVQWLGPRRLELTVEAMDVRPGGSYRWIHRDPTGERYVFSGDYSEVVEPELLVGTFVFDGWPDSVAVDRAEFEDLGDGRTRLVITETFATRGERDGKLQSGMESGMNEGFERLDELLAGRAG